MSNRIIIFIYLLISLRVAIFFIKTIYSFLQMQQGDKPVTFINKHLREPSETPFHVNTKYRYIKQLIPRGLIATILWPIDLILMPKHFIKAFFLYDKLSIFQLCIYYGQTSFKPKAD